MLALSPFRNITSPAIPIGNQIAARFGKNENLDFKSERRGEIIKRAKVYANIYVGSTQTNHQAQDPT